MAKGLFQKEMSDIVTMLRQINDDEKRAFEQRLAESRKKRAQTPQEVLANLLNTPHELVDGHLRPVI